MGQAILALAGAQGDLTTKSCVNLNPKGPNPSLIESPENVVPQTPKQPLKKQPTLKDTPKQGWTNLAKALGFLVDDVDPQNGLNLENQKKPDTGILDPEKNDPNDPNDPSSPPKKYTDYNIQGTWKIGDNETPFTMNNLKIDQDGVLKPIKGNSDILGPYTTSGNLDFDHNVLKIDRLHSYTRK